MRISILIILYNTSITDCTTLAGILHADKSTVDDLSITIWNNGQHTLPSHEIDRLNHLFGKNKISGTLYNTDNNYSLSKIYNFFLAQGDPTHYILFDDDTTIPSDFFTNLTELPYHDVVVPRVFETQSKAFVAPSTKQVHGESKVVMKLGSYTEHHCTLLILASVYPKNLSPHFIKPTALFLMRPLLLMKLTLAFVITYKQLHLKRRIQ